MELTNKEMREILSQRAMDISMALKYNFTHILGENLTDEEIHKKIEQFCEDSKKVLLNAD